MKNIFLAMLLIPVAFFAQQAKEYDDGHGKKIMIPGGDIAFADSLISYKTGIPAPLEKCRNGNLAIGIPDWDGLDNNFTVLGGGGELVVYFRDNALVNIDGADLYVFELGRHIEETFLSISKDGKKWISVGKIGGGNAAVDLGDSIPNGEVFRYVKLQDARTFKGSDNFPGADIDAIAAVGSARSISLNSTFLFNVNKSVLKPEAKKMLDSIASILNKETGKFSIRIEGHTDSTGTKANNQKLSKDRAASVKSYLLSKLKNKEIAFTSAGYADELPAAGNGTPQGREKNRRVEIYIIPVAEKKTQ